VVEPAVNPAVEVAQSQEKKNTGAKTADKKERSGEILFDCPRCGGGWADADTYFTHLRTCEEAPVGSVPDEASMQEELRETIGTPTPDRARATRGLAREPPKSPTHYSPLARPLHKPGPHRVLPKKKGNQRDSSARQPGQEKKRKAEKKLPYWWLEC